VTVRVPLALAASLVLAAAAHADMPPAAAPAAAAKPSPATPEQTIIVGPTVRRGQVDHTTYDTASILKFITRRFGLEPLPGVRANMGDLSAALQP